MLTFLSANLLANTLCGYFGAIKFGGGGGGGGGGWVSRDLDSNPGIVAKLSRDWTSLGWQV